MIADAIKDVSGGNGIVLNLFGGSGSTLIAAHKTGRRAFFCEYDPILACPSQNRWRARWHRRRARQCPKGGDGDD